MCPELFGEFFSDGFNFKASDTFMRKFLNNELSWTRRHGTRAAQKLPDNWEELSVQSALRKAYSIRRHRIPAQLYANSDQTQQLYHPGDKLTYTERGSKQVDLVDIDEKRAFTVFGGVLSSGEALPPQLIYGGKTSRSLPKATSPNWNESVAAGFLIDYSGGDTYWSNHATMKRYVDKLLAPTFEKIKARLGLPPTQMSLWTVDVYACHRAENFRTWMKLNHPTIILDFVPASTTSKGQPMDVGMQRAFKHSTRRSYHQDIVTETLEQIDEGVEVVKVDKRIGHLRDRSLGWVYKAWKATDDRELILKVRLPLISGLPWAHCEV